MKRVGVLGAVFLLLLSGCAGFGGVGGAGIDAEGFFDAYNAAAAQIGATVLGEDDYIPMNTSQGEMERTYTTVDEDTLACGFLVVQPSSVTTAGWPDDLDAFVREWCAIVMAVGALSESEAQDVILGLMNQYDPEADEPVALMRGALEYEYYVAQNGLFSLTVRPA